MHKHQALVGRRATSGFTLLEVLVGTALLAFVLGGAISMLHASEGLARSTNNQANASVRAESVLAKITAEFRRGSLDSCRHVDGSTFANGDTGAGFSIQPVTGWSGDTVLGDRVTYRLDIPSGSTSGDLVRADGLIQTVVATNVTSFEVERDGAVFTFTISTRSGPSDDGERTATGSLTVMARNP